MLRLPRSPQNIPYGAALSRDGNRIVVAAEHTLVICDTETGERVADRPFGLGNLGQPVVAADASLDRIVFSSSPEPQLQIWDRASDTVAPVIAPLEAISRLVWVDGGRVLVLGREARSAMIRALLVEIPSGRVLARFGDEGTSTLAMALCGSQVVTAGDDRVLHVSPLPPSA